MVPGALAATPGRMTSMPTITLSQAALPLVSAAAVPVPTMLSPPLPAATVVHSSLGGRLFKPSNKETPFPRSSRAGRCDGAPP